MIFSLKKKPVHGEKNKEIKTYISYVFFFLKFFVINVFAGFVPFLWLALSRFARTLSLRGSRSPPSLSASMSLSCLPFVVCRLPSSLLLTTCFVFFFFYFTASYLRRKRRDDRAQPIFLHKRTLFRFGSSLSCDTFFFSSSLLHNLASSAVSTSVQCLTYVASKVK